MGVKICNLGGLPWAMWWVTGLPQSNLLLPGDTFNHQNATCATRIKLQLPELGSFCMIAETILSCGEIWLYTADASCNIIKILGHVGQILKLCRFFVRLQVG